MSDKVKHEIFMMYDLAGDKDLIYYEAIQRIIDYIADLEQENERLETNLGELQNTIDNIAKLLDVPEGMSVEDVYDKVKDYKSRIEKAVEYIEKNLLPSHSIEKTDWEFEDVIFSDLPVEVIKPLIDILNGKE